MHLTTIHRLDWLLHWPCQKIKNYLSIMSSISNWHNTQWWFPCQTPNPDPQNVWRHCVQPSKRPDIMHKIGVGIASFPGTGTLSWLHWEAMRLDERLCGRNKLPIYILKMYVQLFQKCSASKLDLKTFVTNLLERNWNSTREWHTNQPYDESDQGKWSLAVTRLLF